jgi:pantothenate kinase
VIDTPGTLTNLIKFTKESGKPISGNLNEEIYLNIVKTRGLPIFALLHVHHLQNQTVCYQVHLFLDTPLSKTLATQHHVSIV